MSLRGTIPSITTALRAVLERVASQPADASERKSEERGPDGEDISLTLLVSMAAVGSIIGQGGATVTSTRTATGASIKISGAPLEGSTEKTVVVSGSATRVMTAVTHILTQLLSSVISQGHTDAIAQLRPKIPYSPMTAASAGARGLSLGVQGWQPSQGQGGRPGMPAPAGFRPPGPSNGAAFGGYEADGFARGAAPAAAFPPVQGQQQQMQQMQQVQQVVTVPESSIGAVIGRQGAHIAQIRQASGCDIRVPAREASEGAGARQITITGAAFGVRLAATMIEQLVSSPLPSRPPSSGPRSGAGSADGSPTNVQLAGGMSKE